MQPDFPSKTDATPKFALVFEGGGAKGVAYVGALEAIEREEYFRIGAVAGASAGAITAALVAAGCTAEVLIQKMPECLAKIAKQMPKHNKEVGVSCKEKCIKERKFSLLTNISNKLRYLVCALNLMDNGRLLGNSELRDWLAKQLQDPNSQKDITFEELYKRTNKELYIVAANVSRHEQIVFSHRTTPQCQVVDAVLASSGIPGVFQSGKLIVNGRLHTIVDGGVWANYPDFVFKDASFREYYQFENLKYEVIGFILQETELGINDAQFGCLPEDKINPSDLYKEAKFYHSKNLGESILDWITGYVANRPPRAEAIPAKKQAICPGRNLQNWLIELSWWSIIAAYIIGIMAPAFIEWFRQPIVYFSIFIGASICFFPVNYARQVKETSPGYNDSWPRNTWGRFIRDVLQIFNPYLAISVSIILPIIILLSILFFAKTDPGVLKVSTFSEQIGRSIVALAAAFTILLGLYLLIVFLISYMLVAFLKRALADWGVGLIQTYFAGTGAPPWSGKKVTVDHVVRIPIPKEISTLNFNIDEPTISCLMEKNRACIKAQLQKIRAEVQKKYEEVPTFRD